MRISCAWGNRDLNVWWGLTLDSGSHSQFQGLGADGPLDNFGLLLHLLPSKSKDHGSVLSLDIRTLFSWRAIRPAFLWGRAVLPFYCNRREGPNGVYKLGRRGAAGDVGVAR